MVGMPLGGHDRASRDDDCDDERTDRDPASASTPRDDTSQRDRVESGRLADRP